MPKASSLKPRPCFWYFEARINGRNVLCLVDLGARYYFLSPKLTMKLGLPTRKADKQIIVQFTSNEMHETKEVALYVTLKFGTLKFLEGFTLYEMDVMDLIWEKTFFKTFTVIVRCKLVCLVMCCDGKEVILTLIKIPMMGGRKLK